MSTTPTKTCKTCFMEMDSRAKKCPHCLSWNWMLSPNNPLIVLLLVYVPIFLVALPFFLLVWMRLDPGRDFQPYRDQIEIPQSEIKFGQDNNDPTVVVLGTIRNLTDIGWKDIQFEGRFFDKDNKLMDAAQERKYYFECPAHDECAFSISFRRQFPQEQYVTHKIRVLSARDARSRF